MRLRTARTRRRAWSLFFAQASNLGADATICAPKTSKPTRFEGILDGWLERALCPVDQRHFLEALFEFFREGAWTRCCRCGKVVCRSSFTSAWSGSVNLDDGDKMLHLATYNLQHAWTTTDVTGLLSDDFAWPSSYEQ